MVRPMFGHRDLLSEGAQANAIVLTAKGYDLRGDSGGYGRFQLDLEVHFPDGTTATITRQEKTADVGLVVVGQIVPVRYDALDRSKVEIDTAAMKAQLTAQQEAARLGSIARAERELANPEPVQPPADATPAPGQTAAELRHLQDGDALPTLDQIRRAAREQ